MEKNIIGLIKLKEKEREQRKKQEKKEKRKTPQNCKIQNRGSGL